MSKETAEYFRRSVSPSHACSGSSVIPVDGGATVSDPLFTPIDDSPSRTELGEVVVSGGNSWQLGERLGRGGFGKVYAATDKPSGEEYAVKVGSGEADDLDNEYDMYQHIWNDSEPPIGIPRIVALGKVGGNHALVLERLGSSFDVLRKRAGGALPLGMALKFGVQAVKRLRTIHERGIVHRDLKPHNFMLGAHNHNNGVVYLADFGLAKSYACRKTGAHIRPRVARRGLVGTPKFAPIASHMGLAQARRDDLESLGYVIMYLYYGTLPWVDAHDDDQDSSYCKMEKIKKEMPLEKLCAGMPSQMLEYMRYVRELRFTEKPNYEYVVELFEQARNMSCSKDVESSGFEVEPEGTAESEDWSTTDSDSEPKSRICGTIVTLESYERQSLSDAVQSVESSPLSDTIESVESYSSSKGSNSLRPLKRKRESVPSSPRAVKVAPRHVQDLSPLSFRHVTG